MKYLRAFKEILSKDSKVFGGKVASLGEMIQAGLPVPEGYGISIEAHREFDGIALSDEFKSELHLAFRSMNCERVAVRSSAVAEDSLDASWAGQLESKLNINDEQLEQAVRDCWNSIKTDSVKDYAKDKKLDKDSLLVGVALQQMVDSEAAGVMFTSNPVTGDSNEVMIEAAYGLGETVVQGIVTPDNYIFSKKEHSVQQFNIKIKEQMMIFENGKNIIKNVPDDIADRAVLREEQIKELAQIGINIANHYGMPQDVEWALYNGKFYIVQSRPITTLK